MSDDPDKLGETMEMDELVVELRRLCKENVAFRQEVRLLEAQVSETRRDLSAAVVALEPFAKFADQSGKVPVDMRITMGSPMARRQLTMGDCYRAKLVLSARRG